MNIRSIIREYFFFNRKEQRGLFVLLLILTGLIIADEVTPYLMTKENYDFSGFEQEVIAFEKEIKSLDSVKQSVKERSYKKYTAGYTITIPDSLSASRSGTKESFVIELNSADTLDLQRLRGIGSAFANRIVKYRERLGGYFEKSQLLEVYGLDDQRYKQIKSHLMVDTTLIKKIDLNSVTFKELMKHPYFPFEVTKGIMVYRKEHKKFLDEMELLQISAINDSVFRKIRRYLEIK